MHAITKPISLLLTTILSIDFDSDDVIMMFCKVQDVPYYYIVKWYEL